MVTIGGNYIIPKGIVTDSWSWTGDEGQLNTNKWSTLLYFPDSSVNVLSETTLDKFMKDYDGTWVLKNKILYLYLGFWGVQKGNIFPRKLSSTVRYPSWI